MPPRLVMTTGIPLPASLESACSIAGLGEPVGKAATTSPSALPRSTAASASTPSASAYV
jgi:hypothetical protein